MIIRRLTCFDYPKLKRLISYLCADDNVKMTKNLSDESISLVNALMPLNLKFKPESFILVEDKEILGLITITYTTGNPYKINITRLIFKENRYDIGKQLVDFIIQKIGAKGATTFAVTIDECHEELLDLFVNGCGFRQCSSETLWKIERPIPQKSNLKWRYAQNSDAENIAQLYNEEVITIFRPSLLRNHKEFQAPFLEGFSDVYKKRYVLDGDRNILGYFSITTSDNLNYILDLTLNSGYNFDYGEVINIMLCELATKKRAFFPLIKQKKYMKNSENFEQYLKSQNYNPVQTQHILVKDFYKPVADESTDWKVFILGENRISG